MTSAQASVEEVEAVIVSFNGAHCLPDAIGSLLASEGVNTSVTVVDNASTDTSVTVAEKAGAAVVRLRENRGYGAAFNAAMRRSGADWLVCANQDVVVASDAIARLIATAHDFEQDGGGYILGPRILRPDGSAAETCHPLPSVHRLVAAFLVGEKRAGARDQAVALHRPQPCGWLSATCLVGRRQVFLDIGGFDERYFMYVEDVDLFSRLHARGHGCVWEPRAWITHGGGDWHATSGRLFAESVWNWVRFANDRWRLPAVTVVAVSAVVGTAARAGGWAVRGFRSPEAVPYARMFAGALVALARAVARGRSPGRPPTPSPVAVPNTR